MKIPWAHRCAILVSVLALIVIALGAALTSEIRTLPGAAARPPIQAPELERAHLIGGVAVAVLTLGMALLASNLPGWLALGAGLAETVTGSSVLPALQVLHAVLSPVYFSLIAAAALVTARSWSEPPPIVATLWNPLRRVAFAVPILIVMQIGLGAAFRYNAMGVISHILNAIIVLAVVLVAGILILRQYPEHPSLRPAALGLVITAGVQVLLGFSVYLVLLMSSENNPGLVVTGVLHVVNGALTLAASLILALQVNRNIASHTGL